MTTELNRILNDCDTLRHALARSTNDAASELRDRLMAESAAYAATIPDHKGALKDDTVRAMWARVDHLDELARELGAIATAETVLAFRIDAARSDR